MGRKGAWPGFSNGNGTERNMAAFLKMKRGGVLFRAFAHFGKSSDAACEAFAASRYSQYHRGFLGAVA